MTTTMRLVDPTTAAELLSLSTDTETAGRLLALDVGFPSVRSVSTPLAGGHGESDTSRWMGARAITATIALPVLSDAAVETIAGYMNPGLRLWMMVKRDGWPAERRILVRGATFTCPPGVNRQALAGWVAPGGLFEDTQVTYQVLSPSGGATGGESLPITYPKSYAAGLIAGYSYITIGGTVPAVPTVDIYGPCTNPTVKSLATGQQITFYGLTLTAGSFAHVDMEARTAYLNGNPLSSLYGSIDFTVSSWWALPPGTQQLLFQPQTPGPGCQAVVTWRNRTIAG